MALDSGALPVAAVGSVARIDFNTAMAQLDAAFPLVAANLATDAVETAKIKDRAVEGDKIKLEAIIAALLGPQAVETPKIKLEAITVALLAPNAVETPKIKNLNVTKAKAELGFGRYVVRIVAAWDFVIGNFTTDGTYKINGLDLSGIVPAGAVAVCLRVETLDDAADSLFLIRHSAANDTTQMRATTQAANVNFDANAVLPIDTDRMMDYYGENLAFVSINVAVLGWFT